MRILLTILTLLALISCKKEQLIVTEGVIKDYTGLDACTWLIEVEEDGETNRLQPINLDEFKIEPQDGLKVKFKYKPSDLGGFCMAGPVIELTSLKEND